MLLHHETTVFSTVSALVSLGLTGLVAAVRPLWNWIYARRQRSESRD